ncbi:MAG: hypothetical protein KDD52_03170, partial [Bdellovibrionales bacterium]|nr:hypothetical protein [Bdellovibrionales bacterium]
RTGRMFTGDRSGQWLYRALYKAGLAKHQGYESRDDGQELYSCYITAAVHCAPPENKPSLEEKQQCLTYLRQELRLLSQVSVIIALGAMAWDQILKVYFEQYERIRPKPTFSHGAQIELRPYTLIGSYHPSQQNTFTGKLREEMFDKIFRQARADIEKKT